MNHDYCMVGLSKLSVSNLETVHNWTTTNDQKTCLCLFDVLQNQVNRDPKLELSRYEEPIQLAVLMLVLEVEQSAENLMNDALMNCLEDFLARNEGLDENHEHHMTPSHAEEQRANWLVLMP